MSWSTFIAFLFSAAFVFFAVGISLVFLGALTGNSALIELGAVFLLVAAVLIITAALISYRTGVPLPSHVQLPSFLSVLGKIPVIKSVVGAVTITTATGLWVHTWAFSVLLLLAILGVALFWPEEFERAVIRTGEAVAAVVSAGIRIAGYVIEGIGRGTEKVVERLLSSSGFAGILALGVGAYLLFKDRSEEKGNVVVVQPQTKEQIA